MTTIEIMFGTICIVEFLVIMWLGVKEDETEIIPPENDKDFSLWLKYYESRGVHTKPEELVYEAWLSCQLLKMSRPIIIPKKGN